MMPKEKFYNIEDVVNFIEFPLLIVSSVVGRGVYSIGEAIKQRLSSKGMIYHVPIEDIVPQNVVNEDLIRYKFISNKFTFLFYFIYTFDIFYYRKYLREKIFNSAKLNNLEEIINKLGIKTVFCISHRPAFWFSNLKRRKKINFNLWGILTEYGRSLGWKYIFWDVIDGYFSPIDRSLLDFKFPKNFQFVNINLPARLEFYNISKTQGDKNKVLFISGFWGQGQILKNLNKLTRSFSDLKVYVVCGENQSLYRRLKNIFKNHHNIVILGKENSLKQLMFECDSIITKPGISSILEAHAAGRKIFLIRGIPIAEDNNARFAIDNFGADWFKIKKFKSWIESS